MPPLPSGGFLCCPIGAEPRPPHLRRGNEPSRLATVTCRRTGLSDWKVAGADSSNRIDEKRAVKEHVPGFTTRFRYEQAAVASCSVKMPVLVGSDRVVVAANRIA